jgi:hypothetical protein
MTPPWQRGYGSGIRDTARVSKVSTATVIEEADADEVP